MSRIEAALWAAEDGDWLLKHIARHADIIHDGRRLNNHPSGLIETKAFDHRGDWLLVPVSPQILDALAQIGAATEDFESTADDEPAADDEPSLGSLNTHAQLGWSKNHSWITDGESDNDCDDEDGDDDHEHDGREPETYEGGLTDPPRLAVYRAADERPAVPIISHTDLGQWRKL